MQPQWDVRRLHSLLDHAHQVLAEPVDIHLVPELAEKASSVFLASYFLL
jgi:hypothetical protein